MKGGVGLTGQSPSAACRSVWQTPQASILTKTSPGPGCGTGTSSITSGLPNRLTIAAFMVGMCLLHCNTEAVQRCRAAVP